MGLDQLVAHGLNSILEVSVKNLMFKLFQVGVIIKITKFKNI